MKSMEDLIKKYNRPAPRYTSYPPVPFWSTTPTQEVWLEHLKGSYQPATGLDLYVHVPFCESLCYYCGCNRTITKDHAVEDKFIALILKEWGLYLESFNFAPIINSLHLGGGTPTFLSPQNLEKILLVLLKNKRSDYIGSMEIDPRTCSKDHLKTLKEYGIKRISLGIQDFNPEVQTAIRRHQSQRLVKNLVEEIRSQGFKSLNFDLIYGLPKQTLHTITDTIEVVSEMAPDLIAFYSYAHLPDKIKNQKLIKEEDLPNPETKRQLYERGKDLLLKYGYIEIGLDHFAKAGSYLYEAHQTQQLQRNFMGHVDRKTSVLLGLGPSSISDSGMSFVQNHKEIKDYEKSLEENSLPIALGHIQTETDLAVKSIIEHLMCQGEACLSEIFKTHEIQNDLQHFAHDGLIEITGDRIRVTARGKPFVRNIAMSFDHRLREQSSRQLFSQAI
jgi:oxygen-independent coproporphyrinogen III oxidase